MPTGLTVSIETDPPSEPYPAAIWIRFSCHVSGNASTVTFNWFYLCSSHNPPMVVITYENRTNVNQFDVILRSTPPYCLDMMMCNASDLSGNSGSATWRIGRVTGEYQFHLPTHNVMYTIMHKRHSKPCAYSYL